MSDKVFGPYKGSKANGGRPIVVIKKKRAGKTVTTSENAARYQFEKDTGKKLSKSQDVDHKDNKGRVGGPKHDKVSNEDVLSHGKNVAKENKVRAKKGKK